MKTNSFKRLLTIYLLVIFGIISTLTSCVQTKQIVYFQGDTSSYIKLHTSRPSTQLITGGDLLAIIISSLDYESNTNLNLVNTGSLVVSNFSGNAGIGRSQPIGYFVDSLGEVVVPFIGKVKVKNMSLRVASDTITNRLKLYLKEPSVNIRILNHKFSVLGEVNKPGVYNKLEDRVSLLEALGMAGDLTIFGKRDNVLLIRELVTGEKELVRLDLTKLDIIESKYFYIQPNDVLYVEPLKTKATVTDQNYQLIPIFTGIVSALGILILNLRN